MFPRPYGSFLQSFPSASIQQLWDAHRRGEEFLVSQLSVRVAEQRLTFPESFTQEAVRQLSAIRALPFWPVRGVYWFLVKRFLMHNRPIWRQNVRAIYRKTMVSP